MNGESGAHKIFDNPRIFLSCRQFPAQPQMQYRTRFPYTYFRKRHVRHGILLKLLTSSLARFGQKSYFTSTLRSPSYCMMWK